MNDKDLRSKLIRAAASLPPEERGPILSALSASEDSQEVIAAFVKAIPTGKPFKKGWAKTMEDGDTEFNDTFAMLGDYLSEGKLDDVREVLEIQVKGMESGAVKKHLREFASWFYGAIEEMANVPSVPARDFSNADLVKEAMGRATRGG